MVDALGKPIALHLTGGQASELAGADALLAAIAAPVVIADKGYDAEARVLAPLREAGKVAVIPPKRNRTEQRGYDRDLYAARHLVEHFFCKRKQYRAIATRYDKTTRHFLAGVHLAASAILLNWGHALAPPARRARSPPRRRCGLARCCRIGQSRNLALPGV